VLSDQQVRRHSQLVAAQSERLANGGKDAEAVFADRSRLISFAAIWSVYIETMRVRGSLRVPLGSTRRECGNDDICVGVITVLVYDGRDRGPLVRGKRHKNWRRLGSFRFLCAIELTFESCSTASHLDPGPQRALSARSALGIRLAVRPVADGAVGEFRNDSVADRDRS